MAFGKNRATDIVTKPLRCLTLVETEKGNWIVCPDRVYERGSNGRMYIASEICARLGLFVSEEGRKQLIKKSDVCYNTYLAGRTEYTFTLNGKCTKRDAFYPAAYDKQQGLIVAPNTLRTLCNFFEFSGGRVRNSAYAKYGYGTIYVFSPYHVVRNCPSIGSVIMESGEPLEERVKKDNSFRNWIEYENKITSPQEEYLEETVEEIEESAEIIEELSEEAAKESLQEADASAVENEAGSASSEAESAAPSAEAEEPAAAPKAEETAPEEKEPERIQPEYFTFFTGRRIRRCHDFRLPNKDIYWPEDKDMSYVEKEGMNGYLNDGLGVLLINSTIYFTLKGNYREPCIKFCVEGNEYHIELHAGLNYTFMERRQGKKDFSEIKQSMLRLMLYKISSAPDTIFDLIFEAEKEKAVIEAAKKAGDCMLRSEHNEKYNVYILTALPETTAETGAAAEENKNEVI